MLAIYVGLPIYLGLAFHLGLAIYLGLAINLGLVIYVEFVIYLGLAHREGALRKGRLFESQSGIGLQTGRLFPISRQSYHIFTPLARHYGNPIQSENGLMREFPRIQCIYRRIPSSGSLTDVYTRSPDLAQIEALHVQSWSRVE